MRWTKGLWRDLMPETSLTVTVHEKDGSLWAEVTELPGCVASGDSMPKLQKALAEAISDHFSEPGTKARTPIRFWQQVGQVEGDADPDHGIDVLVSSTASGATAPR
jgi:predicted RNase H-like HicB family nuclease